MENRVLIQVKDLRVGNGIANSIMNYYKYTVSKSFSIDFLVNRNIDSKFVNIVKDYGSKIYELPNDTRKPNFQNVKYIKDVLKKKYEIFHCNDNGFNALVALFYAKDSVPVRIYHSHNPKEKNSLKVFLATHLYIYPSIKMATHYLACSQLAGSTLFKDKSFKVLNNAMDLKKFKYDGKFRVEERDKLCINNKYVIGVVARFEEQKNPFFVIDIFNELIKYDNNCILIWAGDGSLRKKVMDYAFKKNIIDNIIFLGVRSDVNKLYSVMDVFLLPSKFEGLGFVLVEAQISGLKCVTSECVPEEVNISEDLYRISLNQCEKTWAKKIMDIKNYKRLEKNDNDRFASFDINLQKFKLAEIYENFIHDKKNNFTYINERMKRYKNEKK